MDQEVKKISIKDLVLWTENPRDPIDETAKDQDIVDGAFGDRSAKWELNKLAKSMGEYYDFSELPTVVYHDDKPVVYDGNRRVILGKIKLGYVKAPDINIDLPDYPQKIPCNVCTLEIALQNVWRKHADSGSWKPLERDIFLNKFMNQPKSPFLILEESTGLISVNPHLNQGFVRKEIFREENLKSMGFETKNGKLSTVHKDEEARSILEDISQKIATKKITTRLDRGNVLGVLDLASRKLIEKNKSKRLHTSHINFSNTESPGKSQRQSKRTPKKEIDIFGGKLFLRVGDVSDLYRDIVDLYQFYIDKKDHLSQTFPSLIRMSLRLLCETAAKNDGNKTLDAYVKHYFQTAKSSLDKDTKTTLSNQNVIDSSLVQLLHTGAHNYTSSNVIAQTLAISIIVGAMLTISHGR